ncbi:MAG: LamB/YcsF family protein [Chitinophagaceae bacterium]
MKLRIDLNCDMGEGMPNDALIMPFITSANIACGFHVGSGAIIRHTMALAKQHGVLVGAHPSFHDRENFGRKEKQLPPDKLYAIVLEQIIKVDLVAKELGVPLHHVKPHGALYNMAAKDKAMAATIAQSIKDYNEALVLYGLSGSYLISEAKAIGLKTMSEVFADRTYQDDGSLTPRSQPNALIEDEDKAIAQAMQMMAGTVTSVNGTTIPITAQTICLHGDGKHAVAFVQRIHTALQQKNSAQTI